MVNCGFYIMLPNNACTPTKHQFELYQTAIQSPWELSGKWEVGLAKYNTQTAGVTLIVLLGKTWRYSLRQVHYPSICILLECINTY